MHRAIQVLIYILAVILIFYLLIPQPHFPVPPPGSLTSDEPADTESIYRQAYYTNLSRTEVLSYYGRQFHHSSWINLYIPQLLLNYPPEDAATYIRDQTKSSWLQEYIHPWRESLFINGWYPTLPKEQININGNHYTNKIIIHYFPSSIAIRLTVMLLALGGFVLIIKEYGQN